MEVFKKLFFLIFIYIILLFLLSIQEKSLSPCWLAHTVKKHLEDLI